MKKAPFILFFLSLIFIGCEAQTLIDSTYVYRFYSLNDSVPQMRTSFDYNPQGQVILQVGSVFDYSTNEWELLSLYRFNYKNDILGSINCFVRNEDAWIEIWKYEYEYTPDYTKRVDYSIEAETSTMEWEMYEYRYGDRVDSIETLIHLQDNEPLIKKFKEYFTRSSNSLMSEVYKLTDEDSWQLISRSNSVLEGNRKVETECYTFLMDDIYPYYKTSFEYNIKDQLEKELTYYWEDDSWSDLATHQKFYFNDETIINDPILEDDFLIAIFSDQDGISIFSKLELTSVKVYNNSNELIYKNDRPLKTCIIPIKIPGKYFVEVNSADNNRKVETITIY